MGGTLAAEALYAVHRQQEQGTTTDHRSEK
jgi:hypothetical protein